MTSPPPLPDADRRLLKTGAAAMASGFLVRFGARGLHLYLAAALYGVALYGAFSLATAMVELAVTLGGLGMKKLLFQSLDDDTTDRPVEARLVDAAAMVLLSSLALSALGALIVTFWPGGMGRSGTLLLLILPMIAGQSLLDLAIAATRWKRLVRYDVVARSIVEPWAALAGALIAWLAGWREAGLAIGYMVGTLAALAYAVRGIWLAFDRAALCAARPALRQIARQVRQNAPNIASDLANALFIRFDLALVGLLLGERAAGIYAMARQFCVPIRQIRQSFDSMLVPMISKVLTQAELPAVIARIAEMSRIILTVQVPVLILLAGFGSHLLDLFPPDFTLAFVPMMILVAGEIAQASFGAGDLLFVYRDPARGLAITLVSITAGAALALFLMPRFSLIGAALAMAGSYALRALLRRHQIAHRFGRPAPLHSLLRPVAAGVAALALLIWVPSTDPWTGALATLAALGLYVMLMRWPRPTQDDKAGA